VAGRERAVGSKSIPPYALLTSGGEGIFNFTRTNGDQLFYNPVTNEFGVTTKYGVIRTYFKPITGLKYWQEQTGQTGK
jgi:pyocin large subunit-like protein